MNEFVKAKRRGVTEDDFNKMEPFFARGLQGTFSFRVADYFPRMTPMTFYQRFGEARIGFEQYKYKSKNFPFTTNLRCLTVEQGVGGMVRIVNKDYERELAKMKGEGYIERNDLPPLPPTLAEMHNNSNEEEKIPEMIVKPGSETEKRIIEMMEKFKAMGIEPPGEEKE